MDVKRYRVSYKNGVIEEDGSPRSPHDSEPMVLASSFDALLAQRDALQGKLRVAVEALRDTAKAGYVAAEYMRLSPRPSHQKQVSDALLNAGSVLAAIGPLPPLPPPLPPLPQTREGGE